MFARLFFDFTIARNEREGRNCRGVVSVQTDAADIECDTGILRLLFDAFPFYLPLDTCGFTHLDFPAFIDQFAKFTRTNRRCGKFRWKLIYFDEFRRVVDTYAVHFGYLYPVYRYLRNILVFSIFIFR